MDVLMDPTGSYPVEDMEFDKSADGRYWHILRWVSPDTLFRLRVVHLCIRELMDFVAEIKCFDRADPRGGRGEDGFAKVGEFTLCVIDMPDQIEEIRRNEWRTEKYLAMYGDEFEDMVMLWGRILRMTEIGEAFGANVDNSVCGPTNDAQLDTRTPCAGRDAFFINGNGTIH